VFSAHGLPRVGAGDEAEGVLELAGRSSHDFLVAGGRGGRDDLSSARRVLVVDRKRAGLLMARHCEVLFSARRAVRDANWAA
jgi:hypothetical protein